MRLLSVRLIVSLIVGITLVSLGFSYYEVLGEKRVLRSDLERRAAVLGESVAGNVEKSLEADSGRSLQRLVQHFGSREHLLGIAVYNREGKALAVTPELAGVLTTTPPDLTPAISQSNEERSFTRLGISPVHIFALPLYHQEAVIGGLAVVHDVSYIRAQSLRTWRSAFLKVLVQVFL